MLIPVRLSLFVLAGLCDIRGSYLVWLSGREGPSRAMQSRTDLCRLDETTFYAVKKKYAHLGVSEPRRLQQLEDENSRSETHAVGAPTALVERRLQHSRMTTSEPGRDQQKTGRLTHTSEVYSYFHVSWIANEWVDVL